MIKINSKREIVRQLIRAYLESCKLHDDLGRLGIDIKALDFLGEQCADSAMDIIGFPVDDTALEDESNFCRDWLFEGAPEHIELDNLNAVVDKYVDFLFQEFEKLKKDNPGLFV